ncbi:uncharacterized protein G2W53_016506 [Senna tora]|uniref:Uncharacterized protein n=1 Tax=Senna tora TaxID=362788 RepID=A0A834TQ46_9FABA|nr:uncharacterized protein G2W53_016506 [Senna tora]
MQPIFLKRDSLMKKSDDKKKYDTTSSFESFNFNDLSNALDASQLDINGLQEIVRFPPIFINRSSNSYNDVSASQDSLNASYHQSSSKDSVLPLLEYVL